MTLEVSNSMAALVYEKWKNRVPEVVIFRSLDKRYRAVAITEDGGLLVGAKHRATLYAAVEKLNKKVQESRGTLVKYSGESRARAKSSWFRKRARARQLEGRLLDD